MRVGIIKEGDKTQLLGWMEFVFITFKDCLFSEDYMRIRQPKFKSRTWSLCHYKPCIYTLLFFNKREVNLVCTGTGYS